VFVRKLSSGLSSTEVFLESSSDSIHELECVKIAFSFNSGGTGDADGQILGHFTALDSLNDSTLQSLREVL